MTTLKRDVEIHKQVEQELAKRSHFSQKLIKKLSQKIKELEEEVGELRRNENDNNSNKKIFAFLYFKKKIQLFERRKILSKKIKPRKN